MSSERELFESMAEILNDRAPLMLSLESRLSQVDSEQVIKYHSGFSKLDELTKGFRGGNTYVVGGLEKSGKSSFLMNILNNLLNAGVKVGYINTELMDKEFLNRMAAIHNRIDIETIEADNAYRTDWVSKVTKNFFYAGISNEEDLTVGGSLNFARTMERIYEFVTKGAEVIMVDNLTTFNTLQSNQKDGWKVLSGCINSLVTMTKGKGIVTFAVIHTKPNMVFTETTSGIKNILNSDPKRIFQDSITVTRKPTTTDLYGGGAAVSQVSGTILVWRPYQKFSSHIFQNMSSIILDTCRHAPSGEVLMEFDGAKSLFYESSKTLEDLAKETEVSEYEPY